MSDKKISVRLADVFVEDAKRATFGWLTGDKNRWYATIAIRLKDMDANQLVAEWFYLLVCSETCKQKPFKTMPPLDDCYTVIQDEINMKELKRIATERVESLNAKNWDEFYDQMNQMFLYED